MKEERRVFGIDHAVAGRQTLEKNRLPAAMGEAVWLHYQPSHITASLDLAGCINLANKVAYTPPFRAQYDLEALEPFLALFGLGDNDVKGLKEWTQATVSKLKQALPSEKEAKDAWKTMQQRGPYLLRRNIAGMGADTKQIWQEARVLDSLHETARHLARPIDTREILHHITHTARTALLTPSVDYTFLHHNGDILQEF